MFRALLDRYNLGSRGRVLGHKYGRIPIESSDLQNSFRPSLLHDFRENLSLDGANGWDERTLSNRLDFFADSVRGVQLLLQCLNSPIRLASYTLRKPTKIWLLNGLLDRLSFLQRNS